MSFVPTDETAFGQKSDYSGETFEQKFHEVMKEVGAILIPFSSSSDATSATAATEVLAPSALIAEEATKVCMHGTWGGGEVRGKCTKCDWGEK